MKKILASLFSAVVAFSAVFTVSAAEVNPWKDNSIHVMEIENYDSGYPTGDISTFQNFWSYNKETGFAPAGGTIKNGKLVINSAGTDSFFFKRAKGAIGSSLLQKAQGIGFYVKNGTKSAFRCNFYGIGDKDKMDQGAAMFFFQAKSATFVDMQGNTKQLPATDNLVSVPKGAEGYLLFDFADFVDGWHDNKKLDLSKTDLVSIGYRINDAIVSVRYTLTFDHLFLYGKNINHVPGTINMKTTAPSISSTVPKPPVTNSSKVSSQVTPITPQSSIPVESVASENINSSEISSQEDISATSSEESITSVESQKVDSQATTQTETKPNKINPLVPVLIIAIILVVAAGAIVIIIMVKKKKSPDNNK